MRLTDITDQTAGCVRSVSAYVGLTSAAQTLPMQELVMTITDPAHYMNRHQAASDDQFHRIKLYCQCYCKAIRLS